MNENIRGLLIRGIAAAKASQFEEARFYLEWFLRRDPPAAMRVEASLWMAEISQDPMDKRNWLEDALALNPNDPRAKRALAILNGDLDPQEIVNPDTLGTLGSGIEPSNKTKRFECPYCGGRMCYSADGGSLICDYCEFREIHEGIDELDHTVDEQDFVVALATAKGHLQPVAQRSFSCGACGAVYLLSAESISLTCPHCSSVYVIGYAETKEWIPPEALIPFKVTQVDAHRLMLEWLENEGLAQYKGSARPPVGVYLPGWTFDLGGSLEWRGYRYETRNEGYKRHQVTGQEPVTIDNLFIPATDRLPASLRAIWEHFNLKALVPYDPAFLADWPAETYEVPLSDAALDARALAADQVAERIRVLVHYDDLVISSAGMHVKSFKMIQLPLWLGWYDGPSERHPIALSGQDGTVVGEKPKGQMRRLFEQMMGRD